MSPFVILGVPDLLCRLNSIFFMEILLANTVDADQTSHYVASDLGLHCLLMALLGFPGKNRLRNLTVTISKVWGCRGRLRSRSEVTFAKLHLTRQPRHFKIKKNSTKTKK